MAEEIKNVEEQKEETPTTETVQMEPEKKTFLDKVKEHKVTIIVGAVAFGVGGFIGYGIAYKAGIEPQVVADAVNDALDQMDPQEIVETAVETAEN